MATDTEAIVAGTADADNMGLHLGSVVLKLAQTYPTMTRTVVEAIQNAIDAKAKRVFVGIDMRERLIVVLDDGTGVTREKFKEALLSVGRGVKREDAIGRFGLGLISPLSKCRYFRFASQPKDSRIANIWTFEAAAIGEQHTTITVPREEAKYMPPVPEQFLAYASRGYPSWRSFLEIIEVTSDRQIGVTDLDELESEVRVKLGPVMRTQETSVHVVLINGRGKVEERDIDPLEFTGEPLPVGEFVDSSCGRVRIQLYRAPRDGGRRKGLVTVMQLGDNTQIPWDQFYEQARGQKAFRTDGLKDAFDILKSGYFEGVISAEHIQLDPTRDKFMIGQALQSLYIAIFLWYCDHGQKYHQDETEARQDARWTDLGEKSLKRLADAFKGNAALKALTPRLADVLPKTGKTDDDAVRQPRSKPEADDPDAGPKRRRAEAKPPTERPKPRDPRQRQTQFSFTLGFAYEMLRGSRRLWEFDFETGVLTFNVRHPIWEALDKPSKARHARRFDTQIMHLQEWVALKLLLILARSNEPGFDFDTARHAIDEEVGPYASIFIAAESANT